MPFFAVKVYVAPADRYPLYSGQFTDMMVVPGFLYVKITVFSSTLADATSEFEFEIENLPPLKQDAVKDVVVVGYVIVPVEALNITPPS